MHPNAPSRQSLLRYLLNELDETERERVDTLLIADAEYEAQFQQIEFDLLDALAAGELTAEEAARARLALEPESRFSPVRHSPRPAVVSMEDRRRPRNRSLGLFWFAAAALVLAGLSLGLVRLLHRAAAAPGSPASASAPDAIPAAVVAPAQAPSDARQSPAKSAPTPHLAVLLLPGASRSAGRLNLPLAEGTDVVRIDWPAPADAAGGGYRLQVLDDAGMVFCTSVGALRHRPGGDVVRFSCPARDVPPGIDFVRVASPGADAEAPSLLEVTVAVEKKP